MISSQTSFLQSETDREALTPDILVGKYKSWLRFLCSLFVSPTLMSSVTFGHESLLISILHCGTEIFTAFYWRRKRTINWLLTLIGFKMQVHYLTFRGFKYHLKCWTISTQTETRGEGDILSFELGFVVRLLHFQGKHLCCKTFSLHLWESFVNENACTLLLHLQWPQRSKSTAMNKLRQHNRIPNLCPWQNQEHNFISQRTEVFYLWKLLAADNSTIWIE